METNYHHFDASAYLRDIVGINDDLNEQHQLRKFATDAFRQFFKSEFIHGDRLLDIGTCPSIYSIISASEHVQTIHLSDILEENRNILMEWKSGQCNLQDDFFQYLYPKISVDDIANCLRKKVTDILCIDVTKENPLGKNIEPYDILTSSLCIDSVSFNDEDYKKVLCNINSLLKSEGFLAIIGILENSFYTVNGIQFKSGNITDQKKLKETYKEVGFEILDFMIFENKDNIFKYSQLKKAFALLAKKLPL